MSRKVQRGRSAKKARVVVAIVLRRDQTIGRERPACRSYLISVRLKRIQKRYGSKVAEDRGHPVAIERLMKKKVIKKRYNKDDRPLLPLWWQRQVDMRAAIACLKHVHIRLGANLKRLVRCRQNVNTRNPGLKVGWRRAKLRRLERMSYGLRFAHHKAELGQRRGKE